MDGPPIQAASFQAGTGGSWYQAIRGNRMKNGFYKKTEAVSQKGGGKKRFWRHVDSGLLPQKWFR